VAKGKGKQGIKLEDILTTIPMFRGLSVRQLKRVAGLCEVVNYMAGHSIVRQGEAGDAFYVVLAGQGKVTSGRKFLRHVLPGDHFGEIAVIDGGPRTATVTSETPMTMLMLKRKDFQTAMKNDPDLAHKMMVELAKMFRRVSEQET
jgi:CRP/FNR family cyclic AMP-dependent transcriptional regulator